MIKAFPSLLIDISKCEQNIAFMAQKATKAKVLFRPHFKTHQSKAVGELFRKHGITQITVSSVPMAEYFADAGWNDITIAFPLIPQMDQRVNALAKTITLNVTFSSPKNLMASIHSIDEHVGVFIEVDVGHSRSGVAVGNTRELALMVNLISSIPNMVFKGFLTHAGHSYSARGRDEVEKLHTEALSKLAKLRSFWVDQFPDLTISYGDTPTCSVSDEFWGISEIRPGNFVFYDVMQSQIGSCSTSQVAVALICPVVDVLPVQQKLIIHGGAVHLSKDRVVIDGADCYGFVCRFDGRRWSNPVPNAMVTALSQEHGVISYSGNALNGIKPGDLLAILPVHSCLTVDCMGQMFDSQGNVYDVLPKTIR
ncbi:MAG TPA: alanine racemase [Bacteroidales bacterium]|nr:alanine racemase [Bacteroidales bacterium]